MKKPIANSLQPLHLIEIGVLAPTEKSDPRVRLYDWRFDARKYIPWDFNHETALDVALAWFKEQKIKVYGYGLSKEHYFIVLKPIEGKFAPFGRHIDKG